MSAPKSKIVENQTVKDLYSQGRLNSATERLIEEIRINPKDATRRILLFEMLLFKGEWLKAERQLQALVFSRAKAKRDIITFENNIKAERMRKKVFAGQATPDLIFGVPEYMESYLDAIKRICDRDFEGAFELIDRGEAERPMLKVQLNGEPVNDFRNYYDLFTCCLEVFIKGRYVWLPFENIKKLSIDSSEHLYNLVWPKAYIEMSNGAKGEFYIPALYPNTYLHNNEMVKLGRATDWDKKEGGLYIGYGMQMFTAGEQDTTIFGLKNVEFVPA